MHVKRARTQGYGMSSSEQDDPLARALAPPPNETDAQRHLREIEEQEAAHMSSLIDDELARQREMEKKQGKPIKLLLLGQSESGKSTTLKNFQLKHSSSAFRSERAAWRAIIRLNILRSVRSILTALAEAKHDPTPTGIALARSLQTPERDALQQRLAGLVKLEVTLSRSFTNSEPAVLGAAATSTAANGEANGNANANVNGGQLAPLTNLPARELAVNSASAAWNGVFGRRRTMAEGGEDDEWDRSSVITGVGTEEGTVSTNHAHSKRQSEDVGGALHACAKDIVQLYRDPVVQELLVHRRIRLEDMSGFFLDSLDRVTAPDYVPTNDDVLKARMKTLGVSEYRFKMRTNNAISRDWRVYDVGGHRSLRAAWVPFFDDMNAIIFLAPMSCFDQVLEEDSTVNRIEDSVQLWRSIVTNPLLAKTNLILFLNKSDILRAKLAAGVRFADYVVSYGARPNDFDSVSKYLKRKFQGLHEKSSEPRPFYCHLTSVTDTKSTFVILESVQDTIIRSNLKLSGLVD